MKVLKKIASLLVFGLLLMIVMNKTDFAELRQIVALYDPLTYVFLFVLQILTLGMTAFIWFRLANSESREISFFNGFRINSAAGLIESITPSAKLGGEAAKIYLMKRFTAITAIRLTGLTIVKTAITIIPFTFVSLIILVASLFIFTLPSQAVYSFIALSIFTSLFLYFILRKNIQGEYCLSEPERKSPLSLCFQKILRGYFYCRQSVCNSCHFSKKGEICLLSLVSLAEWILYPLKVYIVASMLNIELSLLLVALATFSAYAISLLPLTPGGLGTFEASMAFILSLNGVSFSSGMLLV